MLISVSLVIAGLGCIAFWQFRARCNSTPPPFNSVDATAELDWFNGRPIPQTAFRVLFIGDSLTLHSRSPGLWDHYGGMAAAKPAKDFVHLATGHIQEAMGARPVEVLLNTGGNGKLDSMLAYLKRHLELRPDLVVLQGGENDAFDEAFRRNYIALLDFYKPALVIVLGDWWQGEKSEWEKAEAHARAFPFVDLLSLYADKSNSGDGGPYGIDGVAHHPSTNGHKAIAHGIIAAFDRLTNPGEAARVGRFISERDQRNA